MKVSQHVLLLITLLGFAVILALSYPCRQLVEKYNSVDEYHKGFQTLGDKLWLCNDDPNSLTTVNCGPDDYSLKRGCILRKIEWNKQQCSDHGKTPRHNDGITFRRELATACGKSDYRVDPHSHIDSYQWRTSSN